MDLSTEYLGLKLRSPLVPSAAQPLSEKLDNLKRMEDSGAGAVVLHSIFEEQLRQESLELHKHLTNHTDSYAEASSFFPEPEEFQLGPEGYLEFIRKAKQSVGIPVIGSLNAATLGGWTDFARKIQQAGADALELNIYSIPTDPDLTSEAIENSYADIVRTVKSAVKIPVAVKISPFFTNMARMARTLDAAGADALVLFNRFYQPDIDLETLEVHPDVLLSTPQALRLPLRWIAILYGRVRADLAATSGIHRPEDVLKMLMAGAKVSMLCSVLLYHGIEHLRVILDKMKAWMEEHEYESVKQMQGSLSQIHVENPSDFERAQYIRSLHSYKPRGKTN